MPADDEAAVEAVSRLGIADRLALEPFTVEVLAVLGEHARASDAQRRSWAERPDLTRKGLQEAHENTLELVRIATLLDRLTRGWIEEYARLRRVQRRSARTAFLRMVRGATRSWEA